MASPLVAGIVALIAEVRGTTDPAILENVLSSTANPQVFNDGKAFYDFLAPVPQQGGVLLQAHELFGLSNLDLLQQRLLANGAGFMQRGMSFDTNSEAGQSPIFEPVTYHKQSHFTNPWAMSHLPPTPPTNSPRPSLVKTSSPLKSQIPTPVSQFSEQSPIFMEPSELNDGMDFSLSYQPTDLDMQTMQDFYDPTRMIINPSLTMKAGWQSHDDFPQQYYAGGSFT